jgi:nucleoside-diphosphate-sugar epimerase
MEYDVVKVQDRPKRGTMDNTKAHMLLNWKPEYTLETGIKEYVSQAMEVKIG